MVLNRARSSLWLLIGQEWVAHKGVPASGYQGLKDSVLTIWRRGRELSHQENAPQGGARVLSKTIGGTIPHVDP